MAMRSAAHLAVFWWRGTVRFAARDWVRSVWWRGAGCALRRGTGCAFANRSAAIVFGRRATETPGDRGVVSGRSAPPAFRVGLGITVAVPRYIGPPWSCQCRVRLWGRRTLRLLVQAGWWGGGARWWTSVRSWVVILLRLWVADVSPFFSAVRSWGRGTPRLLVQSGGWGGGARMWTSIRLWVVLLLR